MTTLQKIAIGLGSGLLVGSVSTVDLGDSKRTFQKPCDLLVLLLISLHINLQQRSTTNYYAEEKQLLKLVSRQQVGNR